MFNKYKKIIIVCITLLTLVGCNGDYGASSSIQINSDLSGSVNISFLLTTDELDGSYSLAEIETIVLAELKNNERFKNELYTEFAATGMYIQYEETFNNLQELEILLERLSGEDLTLTYKETPTDISKIREISGMPTDDLFFFNWIYDAIEEGQLFGDLSNSLKRDSKDTLVISWDDEYFLDSYLIYEQTPVLNQLEQHATLYKNNESSYKFIFGFEDPSIVDSYVNLLTDDMTQLYPDLFTVSSKDNVVTVELLRNDWNRSTLSEYLYNVQLISSPLSLDEYLPYFEDLGGDAILDYIGKHDASDVMVFSLPFMNPKFQLTSNPATQRTVTFKDFKYLETLESFDFTKANVTTLESNVIFIPFDTSFVIALATEKPDHLGNFINGPWLPFAGGIGIGVVLFGLAYITLIKNKKSGKNSNSNTVEITKDSSVQSDIDNDTPVDSTEIEQE